MEVLLGDQLTWNISLLALFLCVYCFYVFLIRPTSLKQVIRLQPVLFLAGLTLLYLMIGSPLLPISHLSFSFHMIQMSMLFFNIPPLLLLGITPMLDQFFSHPKFKKLYFKWIAPKLALYMFACLFLLYHLPIVLQFLAQHSTLKFCYISILFFLSFHMWWPIVAPNTAQRLHKKEKKNYAFLSGLLIMPACVLFIVTAFMDGAQNPFIVDLAAHHCVPAGAGPITLLPPPFNTKYDQVMAGGFMMGLHKLSITMSIKLESKLLR